jgi:hypothetical protein
VPTPANYATAMAIKFLLRYKAAARTRVKTSLVALSLTLEARVYLPESAKR